jgi:hypothetical protein
VTQHQALGSVTARITRYVVSAPKAMNIPYEGSLAAVTAEFPDGFLPSFGSGLTFKGRRRDGTLEFYGISDRGPNGDGPKIANKDSALCDVRPGAACESKFFPSPNFAPSIGVIAVTPKAARVTAVIPIKSDSRTTITGLPYALGKLGASAEVPLADALQYEPTSGARFSSSGLDTEAIALDRKRKSLWISDEYGPFIARVHPASGVITKKFGPAIAAGSGVVADEGMTLSLPAVLAMRRANRGMESLALDKASGHLHGALQSPLADANTTGVPASADYVAPAGSGCSGSGSAKPIERYARFIRWLEFDPDTEVSRMYAYPVNCAEYREHRTGYAKLGDMVALGNGRFVVIEQGSNPDDRVFNRLMLVEVGTATNLALSEFNPATSDLEKSSMTGTPMGGADYAKVVPMRKTLLFDLNAAGWTPEKAEGLARVDDRTLALINDNDFGLNVRLEDSEGDSVDGVQVGTCVFAAGTLSRCGKAVSARVTPGSEEETQTRLWLIKFHRKLTELRVPDERRP